MLPEPAHTGPWDRLLPLESAFNLRDFGGYPTERGGHVRRRTLYRSGTMHKLSEEDERHLAGLGIATVCDLRRRDERDQHPTRWCEAGGADLLTGDHHQTSGVLQEMLRGEDTTAAMIRQTMLEVYRLLPYEHAPSYRAMFGRLLAGKVPLLINCMAGKDRTGVGVALVLSALDVPRETIVEDYVLTAEVADFSRLAPAIGGRARPWSPPPDMIAPLLASDRDYLETTFNELEMRHGGVTGYLEAELGVGEVERARLRELLID